MQNEALIAVQLICRSHNVEDEFVNRLRQYDLVEFTTVDNDLFIPAEDLKKLEQIIRLHYDMDINFEGIEAIKNLLDRMEGLQNEVTLLKNKLNRYQ